MKTEKPWWTATFWNTYKCRKCYDLIHDCLCELKPCPWCNYETLWIQDWNVHMMEKHSPELKRADDDLKK